MSKKRTSVSIDEPVYEAVQESDVEFSRLVNQWAREYFLRQQHPVMDETRIDYITAEIDGLEEEFDEAVADLRNTLDRTRGELDEARGNVDAVDEAMEEVFDALYQRFTSESQARSFGGAIDWSESQRSPENPAIKHQAEERGIDPHRLAHELRRRDREQGVHGEGKQHDAYVDLEEQR